MFIFKDNYSNLILLSFQVDSHSIDETWPDMEKMHIIDESNGEKNF